MTSAILYLRVSTDEQAESGLGLEAQERACRKWCATHGYEVAAVHAEDLSGTRPVDKRPLLTQAIHDLKRGQVLVCARRDRISREVYITAIVEELARRRGARVETVDMPRGDDPMTIATRQMGDVFAQLERAIIATRTRAALAAKRARGEKTGGAAPFGYVVAGDRRHLIPDPHEQGVLELIRDWRAAGHSFRVIATHLNDHRVACRGKRWHATTLKRIEARAKRDE